MTAIPATAPTGTPLAPPMPVTDIDVALPSTEPLPLSAPMAAPRTEAAIRVLLVEELEQVADPIREATERDANVRLIETVGDGEKALERIEATDPDVVIIDALLQGKVSGLGVARAMRSAGRATPVVFLTVSDRRVTLDPETGLAEVLTLSLDDAAMLGAIHRLDVAHRGPVVVPPSGTIAVFSAKGSAGRTAIAHNLAVAMSQAAGARVVLVDGDQVHGDLRLHLEAPEGAPSLVQLPTGHATEDDVAPLLWQGGLRRRRVRGRAGMAAGRGADARRSSRLQGETAEVAARAA